MHQISLVLVGSTDLKKSTGKVTRESGVPARENRDDTVAMDMGCLLHKQPDKNGFLVRYISVIWKT